MWISIPFALQVNEWIYELLDTGKVELENRNLAIIHDLEQEKQARLEAEQALVQSNADRDKYKNLALNLKERKTATRDPMIQDECVYVYATRNYAEQGCWKIGKAKNVDARLCSVNTNHVKEDHCFTIRVIRTTNSNLLEQVVHNHFRQQKYEREFYRLPYTILMAELDKIEAAAEAEHEDVLELQDCIEDMYEETSAKHIKWTDGMDLSIFKPLVIAQIDFSIAATVESHKALLLTLASDFINHKYPILDPICIHDTQRASNKLITLPIVEFRRWLKAKPEYVVSNIDNFTTNVSTFLNTSHKQIKVGARRRNI
jgi:hypothetical protein